MENLNELYKLRGQLEGMNYAVPDELKQDISKAERLVLQSRREDLEVVASVLFEDISSPWRVILQNDGKGGVQVCYEPIGELPKSTTPPQLTTNFEQYLDNLQVTRGTINGYKRSINDMVVLAALKQITGKRDLFAVTEPALIERVMAVVGTDWKSGFPHAMLKHYRDYLRRGGKNDSHEIKIEFNRTVAESNHVDYHIANGRQTKFAHQMATAEDAAHYRTPGEVPTMIMRHKVDWSFLTNGINIPVDRQPVLHQCLGYDLRRGDYRLATLVVGKQAFKAKFGNLMQKNRQASDSIQFRFADSAFTRQMQQLMPELFEWLNQAKQAAGSTRTRVSEPRELTRYFTLSKLAKEDVFLIEFDPCDGVTSPSTQQ